MSSSSRFVVLLVAGLLAAQRGQAEESKSDVFVSFKELETPAGPGAREPNLFVANDGRAFLSWLEPVDDDRFALRFAIGTGWSAPRTITVADDMFVNWADFPSIVALADGRLAAHWLEKNSDKTYAYDIKVALSDDAGATWGEPVVPHRDGTKTQHGFASLLPMPGGELAIFWLDGRNYSVGGAFAAAEEASSDVMALRFATLNQDGTLSEEELLDERTCTCCQTSAALTVEGTVVVYRDRSEEEIRDIAILRRGAAGGWSEPAIVHHDDWEIPGCPVNGPAVAAEGERVALAWFTAAADLPQVYVALSNDGGATFDAPVRIDQEFALGRVDVVLLPDGSAVVSWLEVSAVGEEFRIRRVDPEGEAEQAIGLAVTRQGRTSGFPRMVRGGDKLYLAWTQSVGSGADASDYRLTVRTAVVDLAGS